MKLEELFDGAIVFYVERWIKRPCKVIKAQLPGFVHIHIFPDRQSGPGTRWAFITDIEPIPITSEFLEKNGFSIVDVEGNTWQSKIGRYYVWYETDSNILGVEKDTSTYEGESTETLMTSRILNIHEFQAALSPYTEKEIVL